MMQLTSDYRADIVHIKWLYELSPYQEYKWILRNIRENILHLEEVEAKRNNRRPDWRLYEKDGTVNDQIEYLPYCLRCGYIGCSKGPICDTLISAK